MARGHIRRVYVRRVRKLQILKNPLRRKNANANDTVLRSHPRFLVTSRMAMNVNTDVTI